MFYLFLFLNFSKVIFGIKMEKSMRKSKEINENLFEILINNFWQDWLTYKTLKILRKFWSYEWSVHTKEWLSHSNIFHSFFFWGSFIVFFFFFSIVLFFFLLLSVFKVMRSDSGIDFQDNGRMVLILKLKFISNFLGDCCVEERESNLWNDFTYFV